MIAAAPTDQVWFECRREEPPHERINFWTPTPWNLRRLSEDDRFYFLLKAPIRKIGGFGLFDSYQNLTARAAWEMYGTANGVANLTVLTNRMTGYVSKNTDSVERVGADSVIGCIVLRECEFFADEDFIVPEDVGMSFPRQVVKHKYFEVDPIIRGDDDGSRLPEEFSLVGGTPASYASSQRKVRKGQAGFRRQVFAAYQSRCCVTGETCEEALEAAHIEPYVDVRSNHVQNGLLLRSDIHKFLDEGLISLTSDYRVTTSSALTSESYGQLDGIQISLPGRLTLMPSREAIGIHRRFVFRT